MARKTNIYFIFGAVVVLILGLAAIFGGYGWFLNKQQRVLTGTARPSFPYGDYSLEELNRLYPQTVNENVKTTQTPEETHKKFLTALKAGNFDEAVNCCFREGDREGMKESLYKIKADNLLNKMIGDLDKVITLVSMYENKAVYSYATLKDGKEFGHRINFVKNGQGVWMIGSL